ncbi:bacteriohemerythrin [bacterium]|nr:bacteriohemerythrin [bacterium]MBU1637922.1 bacteriohemerythrin [bacterium]
MSLKWRKELNTGLDWQDAQHQQIFSQLDKLQEAMKLNAGASVIKETVDFLVEYVEKHFHDEEEYMQKHNCTAYTEHKRQHDDFIEEFSTIKAVYDKQGTSTVTVMRLHGLLSDWLIQHIMQIDRHMPEHCSA